jgi:hypothetical protein
MLTLTIGGVDRTSLIQFGSLRIADQVNQATDTADFIIEEYGTQTFRPEPGAEVTIERDGELIYGGVIIAVEQGESNGFIQHDVSCKDYSHYFDSKIVNERYENMTVTEVIESLVTEYAPDFTTDHVECPLEITSISFSDLTPTQCLEKLSRLTGYAWYIDYEKDVHFFARIGGEAAPFSISPDDGNVIQGTLTVRRDLSQVRNRIKVRGGEAIAESITEKLAGDGERLQFPLSNKFSEAPTVIVNGVTKTVGVEYLDDDADFQLMWSYQEKYLRFTAGNTPPVPTGPATTNIFVTGLPLRPIVVQVQDPASIDELGRVYEYSVRNDSLKTRDEAIAYGSADLKAYADAVSEGSFETYTPGLRSGQTISISLPDRGIEEDFLIQSVNFAQIAQETYIWRVRIATMRTMSLIDLLQSLLLKEAVNEGDDESILSFLTFADSFALSDSINSITATATEDYVYEQSDPLLDSYSNAGRYDMATWA